MYFTVTTLYLCIGSKIIVIRNKQKRNSFIFVWESNEK